MKKNKKRLVLTSVITLILMNIIEFFFKNTRRYVFRNLFSNIFGRKYPFIGIGIAPNQ